MEDKELWVYLTFFGENESYELKIEDFES